MLLEGKTAIVTGGTSGIGLATAQGLVKRGARVVLTSRDALRAQEVAKPMGAEGRALDLMSLSSVKKFAEGVLEDFPRLDILIHNAGAVFPKRIQTEDGFDAQLAIIHLGPYLLTHLLLERLRGSAPARVINVASDLHRNVDLQLDDFQSEKSYHFLTSYSRAELAKVMSTYYLARQVDSQEVSFTCLHPGGVRSKLFRNFSGPLGWLIALSSLLKKSPAAGAKTSLHLATAADLENGGYYVGCRPKRSSRVSYDQELQAQLDRMTRRSLGLAGDNTP